ncbi:MAG TPA: hypothetical protein VJ885_17400 [Thermoanaerobaculia bacterium]|nr:hypothetical protein [Thermoanaerobaculia bacterium]
MSNDHPTINDLERLIRGTSSPGSAPRLPRVVRHLLANCHRCCEMLQNAGWTRQRLESLVYLTTTECDRPGYDYGKSFVGAERRLDAFFAAEAPLRESVDALIAELARLPDDEQIRDVTKDSRLGHPVVVRELIDHSYALRYEDPQRMLHWSELARIAADNGSVATAGSAERLADIRAKAWENFSNALRVCGKLPEAEEALTTSQNHRATGTGDPMLRARITEQWASLRTFQGKFGDAIELAAEAGRIYRELGKSQELASALVHQAIAAIYAGETELAIRTLNQAIPSIDPEESPKLLLAACHNLIRCYIDIQEPDKALSLYFEARDLYKEHDGHTTILLRTAWQEGQLLRDLGHLQAAETALRHAREGFLERGLAYEVALVSLDLASVYVRLGKAEDVRRTAAEAVPIFRALRVEREVLGALLQLQQAAGQEHQALELIGVLNTHLAPLRNNAR